MARWARWAAILLTHLNVILAMFAGGALVTAARLKWDPSTYVVVRELFPVEYRVTEAVLTTASFALVVLAHFGIGALGTRRPGTRRVLLFVYAALLCALAAVELAWCGWLARRLRAWLHTAKAERIIEALQYRDNLKPILSFLGRMHPLPEKLKHLLEEAEADAPRNLYVAEAGAALLALVHALAVLLALALAARPHRHSHHHPRQHTQRRHSHRSWATTSTCVSSSGASGEKAPLRTAYRNGRIVVL